MKVHLIASKPSLERDIDTLRRVTEVIEERHQVARDWIESAYKANMETGQTAEDWSRIYKESLEAIAQSDVIVAETSYENFAVGYQIASAVQQKKPVLLLRHATADKNVFATGIEDGWVRHKEYNDDTLGDIVNDFLADNDITTKDMRFNFFINREIYNYLRWSALKTGKTKAEILRELVNREIENKES